MVGWQEFIPPLPLIRRDIGVVRLARTPPCVLRTGAHPRSHALDRILQRQSVDRERLAWDGEDGTGRPTAKVVQILLKNPENSSMLAVTDMITTMRSGLRAMASRRSIIRTSLSMRRSCSLSTITWVTPSRAELSSSFRSRIAVVQ